MKATLICPNLHILCWRGKISSTDICRTFQQVFGIGQWGWNWWETNIEELSKIIQRQSWRHHYNQVWGEIRVVNIFPHGALPLMNQASKGSFIEWLPLLSSQSSPQSLITTLHYYALTSCMICFKLRELHISIVMICIMMRELGSVAWLVWVNAVTLWHWAEWNS